MKIGLFSIGLDTYWDQLMQAGQGHDHRGVLSQAFFGWGRTVKTVGCMLTQ